MQLPESTTVIYTSAILVPVLSSLACLVCIPPIIVNIRARNVPSSVLTTNILILNLRHFVNALIWRNDDTDTWWYGYGFCDIDIKLQSGLVLAMIGAVACLFRQLAKILNVDKLSVTPSKREILHKRAIEIILCLVLPIYIMIGQYLSQADRYWIFSISGCAPPIVLTWPTVLFYFMWQPLICAIAAVYCVLVCWRLLRYKQQVSSILNSAHSKVSKSRFIRLFAMSAALLLVYLPLTGYSLYHNLTAQWYHYSFQKLHPADWSQFIVLVPQHGWVPPLEWMEIVSGFVSFLLFGTSVEALKMYGQWVKASKSDRLAVLVGRLRSRRNSRRTSQEPLTSTTAISNDTTLVSPNATVSVQKGMSSSIRTPATADFDDIELGTVTKSDILGKE